MQKTNYKFIKHTIVLIGLLIYSLWQPIIAYSAQSTKVRIGYQPTVFYTYLFIAEARGMFKEADLDVEFIKIPSANKMFQAYLAGQLDMTGLTATEIMFRGYKKVPGTFTSPLMVELNGLNVADRVLVLKDSPIKKMSDLKGKKIGAHPGTTVSNIMREVLRRYNVNPEDVEIRPLKPNLQVNSLLSGAVDALICLEPTGTNLLASGKVRVLYNHPFGSIEEFFPASFTVLSNEFKEKHPDAAKRLLKVIRQAVKMYQQESQEDRSRIDQIVIGKLGQDSTIISQINNVTYRLPEEWDEISFKRVVDFYMKTGVLNKPLDMETIKH